VPWYGIHYNQVFKTAAAIVWEDLMKIKIVLADKSRIVSKQIRLG